MSVQLGRQLAGKPVTDTAGKRIGTLFNISLDLRTGDVNRLLVTPADDRTRQPTADRPSYDTDAHGRYEIPAVNIDSVDDYLVVDATQ